MGIHRRALKWEHGPVPEGLLTMCREHGPKATQWAAMPRAGRAGYKHVGLEIEVIAGEEPAEDVAGAILSMVTDYASANAVEVFRIDAFDENGDRLGEMLLRVAGDGNTDELETGGTGVGSRWLLKALDDTHKRHMGTLDVLPKLVEMVGTCLEAMGQAVAAAADAKMQYASDEADRDAQQQNHEKQMRLLELLASHMTASKTKASGLSPLQEVLARMPAEVKQQLRTILDALYDDMVAAVANPDPEVRREQLAACISRVTESQKKAMGDLPEEWRTQLRAAWAAELSR